MTTTTATTTTLWTITSSAGMDMGDYLAETADLAIEAMHRDAGYASSADAAQALGTTVEALRAELVVVAA